MLSFVHLFCDSEANWEEWTWVDVEKRFRLVLLYYRNFDNGLSVFLVKIQFAVLASVSHSRIGLLVNENWIHWTRSHLSDSMQWLYTCMYMFKLKQQSLPLRVNFDTLLMVFETINNDAIKSITYYMFYSIAFTLV